MLVRLIDFYDHKLPLSPIATLLAFRVSDRRWSVAVHGPIEVDPCHEHERAAVLRGFVQHFSGDLPWLGIANRR